MACLQTRFLPTCSLALFLRISAHSIAWALDGTLQIPGDTSPVIVWKNKDAYSEGIQLIQANVHKSNPALLMRLIACMPAPGTKAITTSAGILTHDILVIEGKDSGCRGNVAAEFFKAR
jgi:hypothetical protein